MSYELFQQDPEVYILVILISFITTMVAYGAFPLIFARIRKKAITKKKYYLLCYGINFLVKILFFTAINGGKIGNDSPYLLWTLVFSFFGLRTLKRRGIVVGSNITAESVDETIESKNTHVQEHTIEQIPEQIEMNLREVEKKEEPEPVQNAESEQHTKKAKKKIPTLQIITALLIISIIGNCILGFYALSESEKSNEYLAGYENGWNDGWDIGWDDGWDSCEHYLTNKP